MRIGRGLDGNFVCLFMKFICVILNVMSCEISPLYSVPGPLKFKMNQDTSIENHINFLRDYLRFYGNHGDEFFTQTSYQALVL